MSHQYCSVILGGTTDTDWLFSNIYCTCSCVQKNTNLLYLPFFPAAGAIYFFYV